MKLTDQTIADRLKVAEAADVFVSDEDVDDAIRSAASYGNFKREIDIHELVPEGTAAGKLTVPTGKKYGFVDDIFVPESLLLSEAIHPNTYVAVHVVEGRKGLRADRLAPWKKYFEWHAGEIRATARKILEQRLDDERKDELRRAEADAQYWSSLKKASAELGFDLIEAEFDTISTSYGGRGRDTYVFSDLLVEEEAMRFLTGLNLLHEDHSDNCPYDHGHDRITVIGTTVINDWCGPWTD